MVSLVSSSKNGDRIPEDAINNEWLLYPRYADRLEAIGIIGIERCYQYALTSKNTLSKSSNVSKSSNGFFFTSADFSLKNIFVGFFS